ncbi:MAG: GNAT family N-acetyltransferase [Fimbriimonas sp.]
MTEIRPIHAEEAETFLRLMCSAFDLDFLRARSVFFTEPYYDLTRKWALFESGEMLSVLTTTPLIFGWGSAVGIAGVATLASAQRQGQAARLIARVLEHSRESGEGPAVLFAANPRLYERLGFETVDHVLRGGLAGDDSWELQNPLRTEQVQAIYTTWSEQDINRLRRDERRWALWSWNFRVCSSYSDGYFASEPGALREAIFSSQPVAMPLPEHSEWFGQSRVSDLLELSLRAPQRELHLMTRQCPGVPLMFMTDQF